MARMTRRCSRRRGLQPLGVGGGQCPQLVVAVQEVGDGALSDDQAAVGQFPMDLGDAAVLCVAKTTDRGHDVEAEFVIGQGEMGLGLGPIRAEEAGAIEVVTASDGQVQAEDAIEGSDGAVVGVTGPGPMLTFGAVEGDRDQVQGTIGLQARSSSFAQRGPPFVATLSTFPPSARFATLGTCLEIVRASVWPLDFRQALAFSASGQP